MIDETNLETHGSWMRNGGCYRDENTVPGDNPKWLANVIDRAKSMLERDKNHPAILIWSCGNESCGGISKYTKLTEEDELYQGGFVWDFSDQAIMTEDGLKYGGDFGDRPSDYHFSGDGLFFADHKPTTKLQEVKFCYQNFELQPSENSIKIINKSLFTNTNEFDLNLSLLVDGAEVWKKTLDAPNIPAGETGEINIELPFYGVGEYVLTASLCLKENQLWAASGFEIALGQIVFKKSESSSDITAWLDKKNFYQPVAPLKTFRKLRVVQSEVNLGVQGEGFEVMFSSGAKTLTSYKFNGVEFISNFPAPNFWRTPVDNDLGNGQHMDSAQWKLASLYRKCVKMEVKTDDKDFIQIENYLGENFSGEFAADRLEVRFTYELQTSPKSFVTITYKVNPCGTLKVTEDYKKVEGLGDLPSFGMLFTIPKDYKKINFYGFGPFDNYNDRCEGARLGTFETNIFDEVEPYLMPQECGNHCGTRWTKIIDERGRGIKFFSNKPFEFSALPNSPYEFENARHQEELPPHKFTFVKINSEQCGIAGNDSWGEPTLEEYKIHNEDKHFEFCIKGI